jgi:hypothetical protein
MVNLPGVITFSVDGVQSASETDEDDAGDDDSDAGAQAATAARASTVRTPAARVREIDIGTS